MFIHEQRAKRLFSPAKEWPLEPVSATDRFIAVLRGCRDALLDVPESIGANDSNINRQIRRAEHMIQELESRKQRQS
jgi:hypothetical protein